jgi:hypothetical protein
MTIEIENWEDSGVAPSVAAWFQPYEKSFVQFAEKYNVAVAEFLKDVPAWHFVFRHPCGGQGRIDMFRKDASSFSLQAHWHRDDYDAGTRSLKWLEIKEPIRPEKLLDQVRETLGIILRWTERDFDRTVSGYAEMWHKFISKESFEEQVNRYPLPQIK